MLSLICCCGSAGGKKARQSKGFSDKKEPVRLAEDSVRTEELISKNKQITSEQKPFPVEPDNDATALSPTATDSMTKLDAETDDGYVDVSVESTPDNDAKINAAVADSNEVLHDLTQKEKDDGYTVITISENESGKSSAKTYNAQILLDESKTIYEKADDYEHDYDMPYFEPATREEELVGQITELNVSFLPTANVKLQSVLGSGQFGMVYKGVWIHEEDGKEVSSKVAVKTLKDGATEEDKVKFLQEAAIMGQFNHTNILRIQGIVTEGETLKLVVDLMHNGDLRNHLLTLEEKPEYVQLTPCEQKQWLMSYARQIVYGMGYLALKNYVHRDLAARNILVSDDGVCKIADFGLSRELSQEENFYKSHGGKIPVKWTAPEAIHYHKYSLASDIWSYGCLLYEIWSQGKKPFSHLTNMETIKAVARGYRLPPPPGCPKPIYEFMIKCWHPDPESRPTAPDICTTLQKPDYIFLKWQGNEETIYSEETRTLGAALEHGHCMHLELQKTYIKTVGEKDKK